MKRYYWALVAIFAGFIVVLTYVSAGDKYDPYIIGATIMTCFLIVAVLLPVYFAIEWLFKRFRK